MDNIPILPFKVILSYLTCKDRVRCKAVCSNWKKEIEKIEREQDSLVFNIGPYPLNRKWSSTNNRSLMRIENSFQIKRLQSIKRLMNFKFIKKIKKLYIQNYYTVFSDSVTKPSQFVESFNNLIELEWCGFYLDGKTVFEIPSLKVLVIKKSEIENIQLDCPNLETFICWGKVKRIEYRSSRKSLKYLECLDYSLQYQKRDTKFTRLETLNLFNETGYLRDDLLKGMTKLKKLILVTTNARADFRKLNKQRQNYEIEELEIIINGFPTTDNEVVNLKHQSEFTYILNRDNSKRIRDNYANLAVDNVPWDIHFEYPDVFDKFKILPANFFEIFSDINSISLIDSTELNYKHLFGLLKCCPLLECLALRLSDIKDVKLLDSLYLLTPTVRTLIINEPIPESALNYDYAFLKNMKVVTMRFDSFKLPVKFIKEIYSKCEHLKGFNCFPIYNSRRIDITIHTHDDYYDLISMALNLHKEFESINSILKFFRSNKLIKEVVIF